MKKLIALCIAMLLVIGLASFAAAFDVSPDKSGIAGIVFVEGTALSNDIARVSPARIADFKSCETGTFYEGGKILRVTTISVIGSGPPGYANKCLGNYVATVPAIVRSAGVIERSIYYKTNNGPAVLIVHSGKGGCCFGGNVERYAV